MVGRTDGKWRALHPSTGSGCPELVEGQDSNLPASALRATAWSRRSSAEPPSERRRTTSWFVARTRPLCVPLPPPARKRRNSLQPLID
jgi:hypothetical protein